jgi:hypothetical protein
MRGKLNSHEGNDRKRGWRAEHQDEAQQAPKQQARVQTQIRAFSQLSIPGCCLQDINEYQI